MSTRTILSTVGRLAVAAAGVITLASCGSEMLRTGRAPMTLVVSNMEGTPGKGGSVGAFLLSDVQILVDQTVNGVTTKVPSVVNDSATATIQSMAKSQDPKALTSDLNTITLTRYHVEFRRTDGRNTPGVDVPYGFDGGLGVSIGPNSSQQVAFEIVRHQSKLEPPLKNLAGGGGLAFISTIAEVTFYGHDQNGNEVSVTGRMDVQFGDFADQ
jgi:hypothetical protein